MHIKKTIFLLVILTGFIIGFWSMPFNTSEQLRSGRQTTTYETEFKRPEGIPKTAAGENYQAIEDIFSQKLNEYSMEGGFNQIYEPSLQATYYALYILKAIDKLDNIDQDAVGDYIMSHYNTTAHIFMDRYTLRYLDTEITYYPLTTLLETNCYAVLSLSLLDQLTRIDSPDSITFISSCYDPTTHAFIGQPYETCPSGILKVPTMDNTYYAVLTLETLGVDLGAIKQDITDFIDTLQYSDGGFLNDDDNFLSLGFPLETPNIFSSYYCMKTLKMFDLETSIDTEDFHQYLDSIYNNQSFIFHYSSFDNSDQFNLVASALGLELSDIAPLNGKTFLDSGNRSGVINIILNNRNFLGNWDSSTIYDTHELIDTFQIIRALNETDTISQLSPADKIEIYNSLSYYNNSGGFCLLSNDYTSVEQYHNVINSFYLYNRIADIDLQGIYNILRKTCLYNAGPNAYYFLEVTNIPLKEPITNPPSIPGVGIRSYPIEYSTTGKREFLKEWERRSDHSSMYRALDTLKKIFKLDDFEQERNLADMLINVTNAQFLEDDSYSNYGAFLPSVSLSYLPADYINSEITLEHSYYAVKCMELLTEYLNLGHITDLNFDEGLLYNYIIEDIFNGATNSYYDPKYTDNIETILENTYYMTYILKAINMYNQDGLKIKNYVLQNLNYSNIKNIYYSYKISEILDLDILFDVDLTHNLVQTIYSEVLHEFYLTTDRKTIEQQAFLWICEMARTDKVRINCQYTDDVMIGDYNTITASLCNIILTDFGPYTTVKYESPQLGTVVLDHLPDNTFEKDVYIPVTQDNYPQIDGFISVYEGIMLIEQIPISFQTSYGLVKDYSIISHSSGVNSEVNISLLSASSSHPLHDCVVYAEIYKNEQMLEVKNFAAEHLEPEGYSLFTLNYSARSTGDYAMKIFLDNPYETTPEFIGEAQFSVTISVSANKDETADTEEEKEASLNTNYQGAIPIMIAIIAIPSCVIGISTKLKRKTILNSRTN